MKSLFKQILIFSAAVLLITSAQAANWSLYSSDVSTEPNEYPFQSSDVQSVYIDGFRWFYIIVKDSEGNDCAAIVPHCTKEQRWFSYESKNASAEIVKVPDKLGGCAVKFIGEMGLDDFMSAEVMILPDSVERIGLWTFLGLRYLESIHLPKNLKEIGNNAFQDCTSLRSITIPDSVEYVAAAWFKGCARLEKIVLPENIRWDQRGSGSVVGSSMFEGCRSLKEFKIPNGATTLGYRMFKDCKSLKKVEIPESVNRIDDQVFMGCESLEELKIPSGVQYLHRDTFKGCVRLKKLDISPNTYMANDCPPTLVEAHMLENMNSYARNDYFSKLHRLPAEDVLRESIESFFIEELLSTPPIEKVRFVDNKLSSNCRLRGDKETYLKVAKYIGTMEKRNLQGRENEYRLNLIRICGYVLKEYKKTLPEVEFAVLIEEFMREAAITPYEEMEYKREILDREERRKLYDAWSDSMRRQRKINKW